MFDKTQIVISSWLGKEGDTEKRGLRLKNHLHQLRELVEHFNPNQIVSCCSQYTLDEQKQIKAVGHRTAFFKERLRKAQIHNKVFDEFYKSKGRSLLLLDDDVLPTRMEGIDDIDPYPLLHGWLDEPKSMPGPCMFFAAKGLIYDVYYLSRKVDIVLAPTSVVGWAILIHSDLQVAQDKEVHQVSDDYEYRIRCAAYGKLVLKHQRLYFTTMQKNEKASTLVTDHSDRIAEVKATRQLIRDKYPTMFVNNKPIWREGGSNVLARRCLLGKLKKTQYGYVPIPLAEQKSVGLF